MKANQEQPAIKEVHKLHGSLVHRLFNEPLAMSPEAIPELLMSIADDKVGETMANAHKSDTATSQANGFQVTSDRWGNALPEPFTRDSIAYIPITGTIIKGAGNLGRWYGMADLNDISMWIRDAGNNDEVKAIVLLVDSPGGFTTGVTEVAAMVKKIAENKKPVMAYTEGVMASAAYWIGGASTFVYGTPSSNIGSIGAFIAIQDASKFFERMGVKIHVFRSGEYKGIGIDGVSEKQANFLQDRVEKNAEDFKTSISARRPLIKDEDMQGQSYFGVEAASKGFLGAVVDDLDQAVAKFKSHIQL
jgi:signal peptide peptidase SppA